MDNKNKNNDADLSGLLEDLNLDSKQLTEAIDKKQEKGDIVKALADVRNNIDKILNILDSGQVASPTVNLKTERPADEEASDLARVIEGVFNGESMIGGDGKKYNIPPNYASKSKLVEGDILKLSITKNGTFIYKQIGPIDREQLIATLGQDDSAGEWYAVKDEKRWRLLTASVTYFHGEPGDEVVILVPKNSRSNWAAVENIIKTS